jgi:hypothetical protein
VPTGFYAEIIGSTASFNGAHFATYGNTAYDFSLGGARVGFDGASGPISFGSSFAYQSGAISGDALSGKLNTSQLDAYALSHYGPLFAGVEGGASFNSYNDLKRNTGFPTVIAEGVELPPSPRLPSGNPRVNGPSACSHPSLSCRPASSRRSPMALRLRISRSPGLAKAPPYSWAEQERTSGSLR